LLINSSRHISCRQSIASSQVTSDGPPVVSGAVVDVLVLVLVDVLVDSSVVDPALGRNLSSESKHPPTMAPHKTATTTVMEDKSKRGGRYAT
jgi:hypothetical protein